ncbi:site-specific integrase [Laribacter hongkongensis]|uniref:site-specific integrase n=1 Tax=Laribacter hongkongensis TaxID=168471 RepID=UPI001EFC6A7F|nr:site-specific integrase [Laribacter hongkongensis]MCG9065462.1 site-specific integrase [Laribacter hongkongensis]
MNKLVEAITSWESAPELPVLARTRSGVEFDPRMGRWAYRDATTTVNLDFTKWPVTDKFILSAKLSLLWYAEHLSPAHLSNMHDRLGHYIRVVCDGRMHPLGEISSADLINYRSTLTSATSWYLGSLAGLLKKWHGLKYPGVTNDAVVLLKHLRIQGNQKGEAVLTHDSFWGPYSDIELQSLQFSLDRAYVEGEIDMEGYLLAYLFMLLGQRPVQYAALKVRDVGVAYAKDGTAVYTIRVPRAKQRNQLSRAEFKDRVLIPRVGELLVQYSKEVLATFHGLLPDPLDAPLFPARRCRDGEPDGFEYHRTTQTIADLLERTLRRLSVMSERTGQPLHITAIRFRRTVATRAAMEGHGELIIAELLDHTDTQNVGVYIEARPEIVERIDRTVAMYLAPMAQAFAGVIIDDESQAKRAGDPSSRVCDPRFSPSMKPMGNCGKHGFCGFLAPIACYTCVNFQPWLDGPHAAVLDYLIGERDRLAAQTDLRIASVNDRTILAVAEVVRLCEARRSGVADGK